MCGIAGVVELESGARPSEEGLWRMAKVLSHRGPDENGIHSAGPVGFAHARLKIIDLVAGQQPMESPDGNTSVVFNGEVYNFLELRRELEGEGYRFRTRSDTEVLLAAFERYDLDAFRRVNAMLACAMWDSRNRRLILARDRFGKKPLFYYNDGKRFVFGSEIKALLAYGAMERAVNVRALHEYLTYSYIVGQDSILEGVRRVPPGSIVELRDGNVTCKPYWKLDFEPDPSPPSEQEAQEQIEELLLQSVRRRMISDVPLGAFLSGGIDSSTVVALMSRTSDHPVKTFSIGFEEEDYSELEDARAVAQHLGTDHTEVVVKPSALDILPDLVWYLDEPFGDSSAVPTYYVCREARRHVTVALSGDGGDEVFAGYTRYQGLDRYRRLQGLPGWFRRGLLRPLSRALPFTWPAWNYLYLAGNIGNDTIPYVGIYPYIQDAIYSSSLKRELTGSDPHQTRREILGAARHLEPVSQFQYLDTHQYLPSDILTKVDRMSMAVSLEVRCPLLDHTLVEQMARLPLSMKFGGGVTKRILRKICAEMLPPSVLSKKKQGFAIPKDRWFRTELRSAAWEILLDPATISRGYFHAGAIERMLRHHASGNRDYSMWIWCLLILEMWFREFYDTTSVGSNLDDRPFPGAFRSASP